MIRRGGKKYAHDMNRGPMQTTTEQREKMRHRGGKKADELKNADHLKNGPQFYKDTAYGQQYLCTKGDGKVKGEFMGGKDMHSRIKDQGRGRFIRADKNHPDRKVGPKEGAGYDLKPSGFDKDKWYGDKIPLNNGTAQKEHFQGHYDRFAKKQDQRFNNLHTHDKIKHSKFTTTGRHHTAQAEQRNMDVGLLKMNRTWDRTTEHVKPNAKVDKITTNQVHHHPRNGEINNKPHTGQDVVANNQLGQLMGGYYYEA